MVIFDLDGTLLPPPSAERRFIAFLWRLGVLRRAQITALARFAVLHCARYGFAVTAKNKGYLAGLEVDSVCDLAAELVETSVLPNLRDRVVSRLDSHIAAGDQVALVTGTPDFIAVPLARRLGIGADRVVATRCSTRDGRFIEAAPIQHPYGLEKRTLAKQLCARYDCDLHSATAYADSWLDRFLLSDVGHAVAVDPDPRLRRLASARKWEIFTTGKETRSRFEIGSVFR